MPAPKRRSRSQSCACACWVGAAAACVAVVGALYVRAGSHTPYVPPAPRLPVPNAYDDYMAAADMVRRSRGGAALLSGQGPSLAAEQVAVAANQPALALIRSAFTRQCRAPAVRSIVAPSPTANARWLEGLLQAESDVRAARGDVVGALSSALDLEQVALDIERGGSLAHAVASRRAEDAAQALMASLVDQLPASDAAPMAGRLRRLLDTREPLPDIVRHNRDAALAQALEVDGSSGGLAGNALPSTPQGAWWRPHNVKGRVVWRALRERTLRDIEDYSAAALRECAKPAWQREQVPEPSSEVAAMLAGSLSSEATRYDVATARSRIVLAALSIRAYQAQHGRLPASLADLRLPPEMTQDPFSGKPLVYRRAGADYLLYSVGPDLTDDGGVPANEAIVPAQPTGDLGSAPFRYAVTQPPSLSPHTYRRVPHMLPPKLPPGAPPLNP